MQVQLAPFGLHTDPNLGSLTQFPEQQSLPKEQDWPSGIQVQLAPLGLQTEPSLGSLTQLPEQQSLPKVHSRPSGMQVHSPDHAGCEASPAASIERNRIRAFIGHQGKRFFNKWHARKREAAIESKFRWQQKCRPNAHRQVVFEITSGRVGDGGEVIPDVDADGNPLPLGPDLHAAADESAGPV